ncbi:hypothetical protein C9374_007812 [Naegleria lovaniensis]|uniref:Uncharacterized protein n=1 Tax=Naegleria lovaniensis TaxID=51637 RepID=A0AA88GKH2_NAELO|nr:uncharacterized protein C9374_007812 [Naegleria lovaniensis]KAG2379174.1 hypothetical protein C9374_007812 [Naegleria lovaniensis]
MLKMNKRKRLDSEEELIGYDSSVSLESDQDHGDDSDDDSGYDSGDASHGYDSDDTSDGVELNYDNSEASDSDDEVVEELSPKNGHSYIYKSTLFTAMDYIVQNNLQPLGFKMIGLQVHYLFAITREESSFVYAKSKLPVYTPSYFYVWIQAGLIRNRQGKYEKYYRNVMVNFRKKNLHFAEDGLFIKKEFRSEITKRDKQLGLLHIINDDQEGSSRDKSNINRKIASKRKSYQSQFEHAYTPSNGVLVDDTTNLVETWKAQFQREFDSSMLLYHFEDDGGPASLKEEDKQKKTNTVSNKMTSNNVARLYIIEHINGWIKDPANVRAKNSLKLDINSKTGLVSMEWFRSMYTQIDALCEYITTTGKNVNKRSEESKEARKERFLSGLSIFLNYTMFVQRIIYKSKEFFNYFLNINALKSFLSALSSEEELQYVSPNTRRRKIEVLATSLNYLLNNVTVSHEITFRGKVQSAKILVDRVYSETNKERESWLRKTHAMSHLSNFGKYMSAEMFWQTVKRSYHICLAWVNMFYFSNQDKKEEIIQKYWGLERGIPRFSQ